MPALGGTLTFLFTDIEGSTRLWESDPVAMQSALAEHDRVMRHAIEAHRGQVFKTIGDAFCAVFPTAGDALEATLAGQLALLEFEARGLAPLRVRMAMHSGTAEQRDRDYFGPALNRVARILGAGHGGQILLSEASHELVGSQVPDQVTLRSLGPHRLRDIARPEPLYQVVHPLLRSEFPVLKTQNLAESPNNLPKNLTTFVGREKEIAETSRLLTGTRLLTLHGTGGCGKTRLALTLAEQQMERFTDGAWLVELASIRDPALVQQSIATVLGLKEDPGRDLASAVTDYLASKKALLILDNAEHVLEACAPFASAILRACEDVTIIATTREPLGVTGEQTYRVPSLEVPDPHRVPSLDKLIELGSVKLFLERARLVKSDFEVRQDNADVLAQLCYRLDGIPLAIELAAARVRSLTLNEIAVRLDNRFRLLTGGDRSALPRQQTLKALVDWSYELLSSQEMLLFQRLSVFAGGWTLEAAERVTPGEDDAGVGFEDWEVLDLLTSLVDKSLVSAQEIRGELRYRMLETMRQYATDRREEQGGLTEYRRHHRDFYCCFVAAANEALAGPSQPEILERLEMEHDNIRLALDFCLTSSDGAQHGLQMAGELNRFWRTRGHLREARAFLDSLLELPQLPGVDGARAEALFGAGLIAWMQGDYDSAVVYQEQSLELNRSLDNHRGVANSLGNLATIAHSRADYPAARRLFQESLHIRRALGEKQGIANSLGGLGMVAFLQGEFDAAHDLHLESLQIREQIGDREGVTVALINLGAVACELNDYTAGREHLARALKIIRELGNRRLGAFALEAFAGIEDHDGHADRATILHGSAQAVREAIGSPQPANELEEYGKTMKSLEERLGSSAFADHLRAGRKLDFEVATEFALDPIRV